MRRCFFTFKSRTEFDFQSFVLRAGKNFAKLSERSNWKSNATIARKSGLNDFLAPFLCSKTAESVPFNLEQPMRMAGSALRLRALGGKIASPQMIIEPVGA
jgi:hypothetical protein